MAAFYIIPKYFSNSSEKIKGALDVKALLPAEADFTLDSSAYDPASVTVLSNFESEEGDNWQGDGNYDKTSYYEGERSLGLISKNRSGVVSRLSKKLDLSAMQYIEVMIHVSYVEALESMIFDFGRAGFAAFSRYSISNLKTGWNLIVMPKERFVMYGAKETAFDWASVEETRVTLVSRPESLVLVKVDMLRAINNSNSFTKDWKVVTNRGRVFLSLYQWKEKTKLLGGSWEGNAVTLKEIGDQKDFVFSASVSPQFSGGSFGLFIRGDYTNTYGYYFLIEGNVWKIIKRNEDGWTPKTKIITGSLGNFVSPDKEYWLRVDCRGETMKFYISFYGEEYKYSGEIKDNEFRFGGVGIAAISGWATFDNFLFKRF